MVAAARSFGELDALVPVPLHPSKEAERGYNQSQLLAAEIGQAIDVPVVPLLIRQRKTQ